MGASAQTGTPRVVALRLTRNPQNPPWTLRVGGAGADIAVLGWVLDRAPIDAGVPPVVADIVARAACRSHVVAFLHRMASEHAKSSQWTRTPWGWASIVAPPSWKRLLGKSGFPVVAAADPAIAESLFHADGFDWTLRGQIALLSGRGVAPPPLHYEHLERLFGEGPVSRASIGLPDQFTGLLVPGIDGDFIEIAAFDPAGDIAPTIALECATAAIGWEIVSEPEFFAANWHGGT